MTLQHHDNCSCDDCDDEPPTLDTLVDAVTISGGWRQQAACRGMSVDADAARIWFPERGDSTTEAKRVCWEQCPVRHECLEFALANGERFGIFGGRSERERRNMRRQRREAA